MSLIRNLIKTDKNIEQKQKDKDNNNKDATQNKELKIVRSIKSATDLQRFKLEKLMKNPDKPIELPQKKHDPDYLKTVPDFVRNVMGSSAGAGSGEFHVYRHLRRKEYSRQKYIESKSKREQLDEDFQSKLDENKRKAEERTAKKRAKRLKKKKCKKARKQNDGNDVKNQQNNVQEISEDSSAESEIDAEVVENIEKPAESGLNEKTDVANEISDNMEPSVNEELQIAVEVAASSAQEMSEIVNEVSKNSEIAEIITKNHVEDQPIETVNVELHASAEE